MTLENWLANRWIKRHETSRREITDLLLVVDRDLSEASNETISADWRLNIAFNASLQCGMIALMVSGYRASGEVHHERVINSLRYTIKVPEMTIKQLNRLRKKRITITYDAVGTVSDQEVSEAITLARDLREIIRQ
jgi:hypothetical protein